ncbi:MAG TPA: isocitrate lyase/PEP mutase family protein [Acidimicrobiales bacterium]|nr:isocitrate lyase/PEP mutase family protein [Acidimicrobiales bacterium]
MSGLLEAPSGPRVLRELLAGDDLVVAPGAFDALSARLIEEAGFPAVYMTGFGTAASLLGRPDIGLLSGTEMIDNARRIAGCVGVPVIADADTGYGNAVNVIRTVRDYERAGVAGIHIEDQVMPKRCGHLTGKVLVPADEMASKIRAAVAARTDPDFVVIARTDARAVEGLDAALRRAAHYLECGADVLFVEAPENDDEIETVARHFTGVPLLFNWAEGGRTPPVSLERLRQLGFRIVIFPIGALLSAATSMRSFLTSLRRDGTSASGLGDLPTIPEFVESLGMAEVLELQSRFGDQPTTRGEAHG